MVKEVKEVLSYKGHSVKANGSVDLSFTGMYDQAVNSIKVLQMLNADVSIVVKLPGEKPFKLGMFRIKSVNFDGDGESTLKFNSIDQYVELNNVNKIITSDSFQVKMVADVEEENEEGEE